MSLELYFLGTGTGRPTIRRNCTSIVLRLPEEGGRIVMVDAGSGTLRRILRSPLDIRKLDTLFVTHLHGDHVLGVPEVLHHWAAEGGRTPLTVYGPTGIAELLDVVLKWTAPGFFARHPLSVVELKRDGEVFAEERLRAEAHRLVHGIECYGYRLVYREGGAGRKIVTVMGDTEACDAQLTLARHADVLVHEAFASIAEKPRPNHSFAEDVGRLAREAGVGKLFLIHLARKYEGREDIILEEVGKEFPHAVIAEDLTGYIVE